ncbi:alpha/beta-hydrolase [Amylostereum chailletii]|nr:alpha/beta-hydrolase [Amylostereum chailletii]
MYHSSLLHLLYTATLSRVIAANPEVILSTGTFRGLTTPNGTDRFLGVPYAQPPVGNLRFKAPVAITTPFPGIQDALQFGSIINRSVEIGKPIVFVSINYRLNTFGFLASTHVPVEDLNAGLQDQRAAFTFIQENVAEFGGDPDKSAGAGSVEAQIIFPSNRSLFRGAIMDSMTGPFKNSPAPSTFDLPGKPFDITLKAVDCPAGPAAFACLQQAPFDLLVNFSNTQISDTLNNQFWEPTIAPGSFSPVRASSKVAAGDFLHIPMIAGTNLNEGATFTDTILGLNSTGAAQDSLFDKFILESVIDQTKVTSDVLSRIHSLYPANTPTLPFSTGDSLFDRASAWYGDNMFLAARRRFVDSAASLQPVFAYHFREFIPGNNVTFGVAHASELPLLFGGPIPASDVELEFANTYLDFYLNFISDLNPGPAWPQFSPETNLILQLKRDNITPIVDNFREEMTDFLNSVEVLDEWEK